MAQSDAKQAVLGFLQPLLAGEGEMGEMISALPFLVEQLRPHAAADFVCALVPVPPSPGLEFAGIDGVAAAWREWGSTFESVRGVAQDLLEGPASIVLLVDQIAVTKHGGVELRQPSAVVFLFSGEALSRVEFHLDRAAARRAGGLA
jgi:hypothetical protein